MVKSYYVLLSILFLCLPGNGTPVPNNEIAAGKPEKVVMPAMARKAGGSWRPELLPEQSTEKYNEIHKENESEEEEDYEDDESDYKEEEEEEERDCPRGMYYFYSQRFGRGQGKCVPNRCTGRNAWRSPWTGDCFYDYVAPPSYNNAGYYRRPTVHRSSRTVYTYHFRGGLKSRRI